MTISTQQKLLHIVPILVACVILLVSLLGILIYGIYAKVNGGPTYVSNQYWGVWLSLLLLSVSIQTVWSGIKSGFLGNFIFKTNITKRASMLGMIVNLIFYSIQTVITIILFSGFCLSKRPDSIVWTVVLILLSVLNIVINMQHIFQLKSEQSAYSEIIEQQENSNSNSNISSNEGLTSFSHHEHSYEEDSHGTISKKNEKIVNCCYIGITVIMVFVQFVTFLAIIALLPGSLIMG